MNDGGLRPMFREKLRVGFDWQSVETGGTGMGCPDANYCSEGVEGWVEFKQTHGWACTLRPEQVGWHVRRWMHGGITYIATRRWKDTGESGIAVDELWLHEGRWARELKTGGLRAVEPIVHCTGGPSQWDWESVRRALTVGRRFEGYFRPPSGLTRAFSNRPG